MAPQAQIGQEKAFELTSTAENSTVSWWDQYRYIEDIKDGRGYTRFHAAAWARSTAADFP